MLYGKRFLLSIAVIFVLLFFVSSSCLASEGFIDDPDAVEEAANSVFLLEVYNSSNVKIGIGSGFVAFNSRTLVTNYHVIDGGAYIIAVSDDSERYFMQTVITSNKEEDIAILRFSEPISVQPLEIDTSSELKRAQRVIAIGSPAGLKNTVSIGNISAFLNQDGKDWIQFTAPISSGSSGGALLNDKGKVIGITTATYASTQNVNLAIKATSLVELYNQSASSNNSMGETLLSDSAPSTALLVEHEEEDIVWITRTGSKYHSSQTCSGMKSPIAIQLVEAIEKGYQPCGKCYK